jgi:NAD(P)-dependent dehydrogenase (short-subunit alcohol dehydrogenase family)
MTELNNKTVLITGGSKGIGYGIAKCLLDQDMNVAITSRYQDAAEEAAEKLSRIGTRKVIGIAADVRDPAEQKSAVIKTVDTFGGLDVLIANAGLGHFSSIEDMTDDQWNQTIDINLTGVFNSVKACIPELKKSKGYIITIASLAGTNFFAGGAAYNASKFGLVGFTQAIMLDLRHLGIKVTTIMPGSVSSYFGGREPADDWRIQPEDIGKMVVDLLNMHPRTLPSKIEVRPSMPPSK